MEKYITEKGIIKMIEDYKKYNDVDIFNKLLLFFNDFNLRKRYLHYAFQKYNFNEFIFGLTMYVFYDNNDYNIDNIREYVTNYEIKRFKAVDFQSKQNFIDPVIFFIGSKSNIIKKIIKDKKSIEDVNIYWN